MRMFAKLRVLLPLLLMVTGLALAAAPAQAASCWKVTGWGPGSYPTAILVPADCTVTPPGYVWTQVHYGSPHPEDLWILVPADDPFLQTHGVFYYYGLDANGVPRIRQDYIVSTEEGSKPVTTTTPPLTRPKSGVNIDVPFDLDPVCGFQITLRGNPPQNFYTGGRNPWGNPTIQETPPGSRVWVLTFGGLPAGPCISKNDPRFYDGGKFLGLHFGFWTDDAIVDFIGGGQTGGAPCTLIGLSGAVPCTGITGHKVDRNRHFVDVLNPVERVFNVRNAQIVTVQTGIGINGLTRNDLGDLPWQPLPMGTEILPPASGGQPGVLTLGIPEDVQLQQGFAVLSFDVADPMNPAALTTVTLEFPLQ